MKSLSPCFVGIDLGTSNSALVYSFADEEVLHQLPIPQLHSKGKLLSQDTLPSFMYLPREGEVNKTDTQLPWQAEGEVSQIIGSWARDSSVLNPERCINSAKSWLCQADLAVDAEVLPWQAEGVQKFSPSQVISQYLKHLQGAFEQHLKELGRDILLADCKVVLTVPASFDDRARKLTSEAATSLGIKDLVLLEEPLAAFYSFISAHEKEWRDQIEAGDLVLVCDLGGGTTDLSLVAVGDQEGKLELNRVSVGRHLLLGGDNMDLALAYTLKAQSESKGKKLDHWQFKGLINGVRLGKEKLFQDPELESYAISVASKSASLFAGSITIELTRSVMQQVLINGFFPDAKWEALENQGHNSGLMELGLPYESEPAVTKHLVDFLINSQSNMEASDDLKNVIKKTKAFAGYDKSKRLLPTKVLFNGGVCNGVAIREHLTGLLNRLASHPVEELTGAQLDLAVAKGACFHSQNLGLKKGLRIRSGTARSYYLGLETAGPAVPGIPPIMKGLCVVPQGTEEGTELPAIPKQFGLVTGKPVAFRFYSSVKRAGDQVGTLVHEAFELDEAGQMEVTLPQAADEDQIVVPVKLGAKVSEMGMLNLQMQHCQSEQSWNLEFNVRGGDE